MVDKQVRLLRRFNGWFGLDQKVAVQKVKRYQKQDKFHVLALLLTGQRYYFKQAEWGKGVAWIDLPPIKMNLRHVGKVVHR